VEEIRASTVLWAAGVRPTKLGKALGVDLDRGGRVKVEPDLSIPGHPEVFAIGDMAGALGEDGKPLAGVSQVAMQGGAHAARMILRTAKGEPREPFHYWDTGIMATIGRSRAIVQMGKIRFAGFFAWVFWLAVHIFYLIGFRNRLVVMISWAWSYVTYRRGARLITHATDEVATSQIAQTAKQAEASPPAEA
jgi:NADH dehydrogenase